MLNSVPCWYYTIEQRKHAMNFKDANKGKLHMIYKIEEQVEPLALIEDALGEFKITYISLVKVIGDDTERVKAKLLQEVLKLAEEVYGKDLNFITQLKLIFQNA